MGVLVLRAPVKNQLNHLNCLILLSSTYPRRQQSQNDAQTSLNTNTYSSSSGSILWRSQAGWETVSPVCPDCRLAEAVPLTLHLSLTREQDPEILEPGSQYTYQYWLLPTIHIYWFSLWNKMYVKPDCFYTVVFWLFHLQQPHRYSSGRWNPNIMGNNKL